jgi:hypothetical protein
MSTIMVVYDVAVDVQVWFEYLGFVPLYPVYAVVGHAVTVDEYEVRTVDTWANSTTWSVSVMVVVEAPPRHGMTVETKSYVVHDGTTSVVLFLVIVSGLQVETGWYCEVTVMGFGAALFGQSGQGVIVAKAGVLWAETTDESP